MTPTIPVLILAAFLAGLVESAAGFGSALLAMPVLVAVLDVRVAAPLFAVLAIVLNGALLHRHRASFQAGEASRLVLGAMLGIPLGLHVLKNVPEALVENVLGSLLVLHAAWSLFSARGTGADATAIAPEDLVAAAAPPEAPSPPPSRDAARDPLAVRIAGCLAGFVAGALGGAYNTAGPPVVLYGSLRRWPRDRFKSNLQGFSLATGVLVAGGHVAGGLVTDRVVRLVAILAVPMLCGAALGSMLDRKISSETFGRILFALTGTMGVWILVR